MRTLNYSKLAVASRKRRLSRSEFEQICYRAAKNSTSCDQYIDRVLTHLCRWLKTHDGLDLLSKEGRGRKNTQRAVLILYNLLEKNCRYDFDVAEVLNSCSDLESERLVTL